MYIYGNNVDICAYMFIQYRYICIHIHIHTCMHIYISSSVIFFLISVQLI